MILYKITNLINNKVYIGQTIRPMSQRWLQHLRDSVKLDYPLYRALRKHGKDNFTCQVIETFNTIEELNKAEFNTIARLKTMNRNVGYNILPGGKNYDMPQGVKDKISKKLMGKKQNRHITNEEKSKIAKQNGSKLKYDEKWAISNGSSYFRVYRAIRLQFRTRSRPSIYIKGEFVGEYLTYTECSKKLNIKRNHIGSCLLGKRPQTYGYIFEKIKEN